MRKLLIDSKLILYLSSLGDIVPLDFTIDISKVKKQLEQFQNDWKQYNPRTPIDRQGLSITSLDGGLSGIPDLDSLFLYNQKYNTDITEKEINIKTDVANKVFAIHPILDIFKTLGRSHFIRLNSGGFFPPHRDGKILNVTCFRIITLCHNCSPTKFSFVYEDKLIKLEPGRPYFVNTRKTHSVFSYADDSVQCVLNVPLTEDNYNSVVSHLREK